MPFAATHNTHMPRLALFAAAAASAAAQCTLTNLFGDPMVLQRDTATTVVNGFAKAGDSVTLSLDGKALPPVTAAATGIWKTALPPTSAGGPHALSVACAAGGTAALSDVLFGDVFLCGGW